MPLQRWVTDCFRNQCVSSPQMANAKTAKNQRCQPLIGQEAERCALVVDVHQVEEGVISTPDSQTAAT